MPSDELLSLPLQLKSATYSPLTAEAKSQEVKAFSRTLATKLFHQARRPTQKQIKALIAIIADLLERDPEDNGGWLYLSLSPNHFTGSRVGYRPFLTVFNALRHMTMIEVIGGTRQYANNEFTSGKQVAWDRATRFRPSPWLVTLCRDAGVTRENWTDHFVHTGIISTKSWPSIELRATKRRRGGGMERGAKLSLDRKEPVIADLFSRMDRMNDFLGKQVVEPFGPVFLKRIFANGDQMGFAWDCGGRMTAPGAKSYQTAKKYERTKITLNGEQSVEIDLRASHLTLLVGLGHLPKTILEGDPYEITDIPRVVVKQWVTMTLSNGRRHSRWPTLAVDAFKEKHGIDLPTDFPLRISGDAILAKLPILDENGLSALASWGELQFHESEILLKAMETLAYDFDVAALPVHDSLIVPETEGPRAVAILKEAFRASVGLEPIVN